MIKRIAILVIWVAVGMLVAFAGQTAWRYWQQRDPATTDDVAAGMKETVEAGKKTAVAAAAGLRREAEETLAENTAKPKAEATAPTTKPASAAAREDNAQDRLNGVVADTDSDPAMPTKSEQLTAQRTEAEVTRQRKEDALFQRQMRIFDELSGE